MISEPTYLAARMVSHRIAAHFAAVSVSAVSASGQPVPVPDAAAIESLLDTAFWASLRKEEGYQPKISLVFAAPAAVGSKLLFRSRKRLTPDHLVKLSPAVVQPGIHLGVWAEEDGFYVWGTAYELPPFSLVIEVIEAGLLVVKQRHGRSTGKLINVAVLNGNQIKVVDDTHWGLADCPGMLSALLGSDQVDRSDNMLVRLALAMRRHGRGGLLLVVPQDSSAWLHSIVKPINYLMEPEPLMAVRPGEAGLAALQAKIIDAVGGYSAIDGATVITRDHRLLAFGAKVARSAESVPVGQVMLTEPVEGSKVQLLDATALGGTRHLAAAQFVHDQHDALAMVASQDGTFTVFSWLEKKQLVHAHRIEVLLM